MVVSEIWWSWLLLWLYIEEKEKALSGIRVVKRIR